MAKYIKNKELLEEVKACKQTGVASRKLAEAFLQIATRYGTKPQFAYYSYRDDMVGEALFNLSANWHKFDPDKSQNPFAYFTQIVHNSFIQVLNREKTQRNVRDAMLMDQGMDASWTYQEQYKHRHKHGDSDDKRAEEDVARALSVSSEENKKPTRSDK